MAHWRDTTLPASGSTDWFNHYSGLDEGRYLMSRGHPLETFDGATDDDKLGAAMSYAAAQTMPPPILFGPRNYTLTTPRAMYDGMTLLGVPGMGNAELSNQGTVRTRITANGGSTFLSANGGNRSGSQQWDVAIRNIAFTGSPTTQFMGGTAVIWCMNLRDCSWSGFKSILGSQATKLLVNLCLFDGWLSFHNSYSGAIHIGGSDNALFLGMTNIDAGTAFNSAGSANGQYHLWLDNIEKTTIGPIYLTAEGAWNGIRVSGQGNPATSGGSNLGGPLWITGAKIEGRNAGAPCNGSLIRVEGGELHLRDTWLGYAMASPSTPGHSPTDAGVVHQTAGQLLLDGVTYDRATGVAESVPLVYSAGGESHVNHITRGSKGGAWTGRPRVSGATFYDSTVTAV